MPGVWKVAPVSRALAVAGAVLAVWYLVMLDGPVVGAVGGVLLAGLVWLFAFRPALIVTATEVIVRNPWGTRRVPLADVDGAAGGYFGLTVRRRSGGAVTAWAVQKSNGATWSGRRTRADEAADAIRAAAQAPVG